MTWTSNLQGEIAEQFCDPRWCDIQNRAKCYDLSVSHEQSRGHIVSVKADENIKLQVLELVHTRPAWTAQELAAVLGRRGHGDAIAVGCLLPGIPGLLKCSGTWNGQARSRAHWVSVPAVLELIGSAAYVLLKPLSERTEISTMVLATALKSVGWCMRRVGTERRWYRPTECAQSSAVC